LGFDDLVEAHIAEAEVEAVQVPVFGE